MTSSRRILALAILAICGGCQEAPDTSWAEGETENVQAGCRRIINAVYAGDVDTVLTLMHPRIIQTMGDPSQAKLVVRSTMDEIKLMEMKLESLTFPEEPTFVKGDAHEFAIVPTLITTTAKGGKRVEALSYQLAVRDVGTKSWTYIEGSRVTTESIQSLFPDFPAEHRFPRTYRGELGGATAS